MWWLRISIFGLIPLLLEARLECSRDEYDRCVKIADPLVREAHLVFPDNINDIDQVCLTWNQFVDCLKRYTEECFTDQQRKTFNRAVESPIESVHQMCRQPQYQKEYLQYAPCIKNTIIQHIHCGDHYNLLVDQVDQGDIISKSTLCCSHEKFKQCVQRETRRLCDRGVLDGPAAKFAGQIIDKALRFLQDQCLNYIPNTGDCQAADSTLIHSGRSDTAPVSTSSSEVYPWSTVQQQDTTIQDVLPSRIVPPRVSTTAWLPSSEIPIRTSESSSSSGTLPTSQLGTRSRPSSYGRSNNWRDFSTTTTEASTTPIRAIQLSSTRPPQPASVSPSWAAGSTQPAWTGMLGDQAVPNQFSTLPSRKNTEYLIESKTKTPSWNPSITTTQETWYPAAGSQLSNEVDEPNQLGLRKLRNTATTFKENIILFSFSFLFSVIYYNHMW